MNPFISDIANGALLITTYNPLLVLLSCLIAIGGSALSLFVVTTSVHMRSRSKRQAMLWLGATAFGLAAWCTHFTGMLALSLPTTVRYDTWLTLLSALPAILAGRLVLPNVIRQDVALHHLLVGGIVSAIGIGLMHCLGMMAMQMPADFRFDPLDFAVALMATAALSAAALGARASLTEQLRITPVHATVLSALILGIAITTMHFSGMAATSFTGQAQTLEPIGPEDALSLVIMMVVAVVSILALAVSGVVLTKLTDSLTQLKVQGYELDALTEHASQGIVTILGNGKIKGINRKFENIFKCTTEDAAHQDVTAFIPEWPRLMQQTARHMAFETVGKRKNGDEFPLEIKLTQLKSGSLAYDVGFINDLSDTSDLQGGLHQQANYDFLTGLHNRRFFEEQLGIEFSRSDRSGNPLSLILLDIDHFKAINDDFGRVAGDKVLAMLASMLRMNSRHGDIVCRYDGEEFLVLLPNTDLSCAMQVAERIRSETENLSVNSAGKNIQFTASLGVTGLQSTFALTPKDLVRQADMALYRAKQAGRNRVECEISGRILPHAPTDGPAAPLDGMAVTGRDPEENALYV